MTVSLDSLGQDVIIPLAAFLLEYPVAYVPASAHQTTFLPGECLDVYDCTLVSEAVPNSHSLLKFSCPHQLGLEHMVISPVRLMGEMKLRYETRLKDMGCNWIFGIQHHTESFDRVAL
jgi:hypothetical protein